MPELNAERPCPYKLPRSVLVLVHSRERQFLLIDRADGAGWQSVTGSVDTDTEPLPVCCRREVFEETGIEADCAAFADTGVVNEYEIYPRWRHRYEPGVSRNIEHVFALQVPRRVPITLSPREHRNHCWLPAEPAAARCFSPSNAEAILAWDRRLAAQT